jgi:hypothetical protein
VANEEQILSLYEGHAALLRSTSASSTAEAKECRRTLPRPPTGTARPPTRGPLNCGFVFQPLQERDERAPKELTFRRPGRGRHQPPMGFQSGNDLQNVQSFSFESGSVQTEIDVPLRDVQGEPLAEDLRMALAERLVCLLSTVDL